MSEYKIAVVIPTLNEEKFIAQCLNCIINQTYPFEDMDLMVVDGGSKDRTEEIVEEYHKKHSNIRFIHNPGKIQSIAFNIGAKNSNAPYIVRLDAHALYEKDYIEKCIEGLKADENRGNVGGRCIILPFNDSLWAKSNAILNYSRFGIGGSAFRVGIKPEYVDSVPFGAFPQSLFEKVGGMREDLPRAEDNEYNSRIRKAGYKVYFDPEIVSSYYARPTLESSCKQMYANGESIGHLFYVDRDSIGLRHIIPLLFVLGIIIGGVISVFWTPFLYVLLAGLGLYIVCDLVASFLAAKGHGWKYLCPLLVLFFCVHVSYGWGTVVGLFTGRKLKPIHV
jgi:glycosyltransferase involved in cell wall biosynthesis